MTKEEIISEIKRTAKGNKDKPPGEKLFCTVTGISRHTWRGKYWRNWGDALVDAGFSRNAPSQAFENDFMLRSIVLLIRKIGHFPTGADMQMEKMNNESFPNMHAISRLGILGQRHGLVRGYISEHKEYSDVLSLLPSLPNEEIDIYSIPTDGEKMDGFVYIVKEQYSKLYKIGKTFDVPRRHREISLELPGGLKKVHSIRTDDPSGIEAYWHKRFENKRRNGEWFALRSDDIKVFKRRKSM